MTPEIPAIIDRTDLRDENGDLPQGTYEAVLIPARDLKDVDNEFPKNTAFVNIAGVSMGILLLRRTQQ